jgi:hypothetical protein
MISPTFLPCALANSSARVAAGVTASSHHGRRFSAPISGGLDQVCLADDTNEIGLAIDDRQRANIMRNQELYRVIDIGVGCDCHDIPDHHISRPHDVI